MMKMYSPLSVGTWACMGAACGLLLTACAPGQDAPAPSTVIDASNYVAVGDTYTAGQSSGGLTRASQEYSYPNLLAQQFRRASNATFSQPYLEPGSGSGYLSLAGFSNTGLPMVRRVAGQAVLRTVINPNACGGPDTVRLLTRSATAATLPQNLGVPGLLLTQLETAGLGNAANATPGAAFNPYFERLLPAADNRTYLKAVTDASAPATFFTYFLGLDDLMPYVRSGGTCPLTANLGLIMNLNAKKVLDVLTAKGRPGIIAKLPPLFTLALLRQGAAITLQRRLQTAFGDTARLYVEKFGTGEAISDGDYVLATTLPRIGVRTPVVVNGTTLQLPYGRDIRNPLRNADVLAKNEYDRVKVVLDAYNEYLEGLAKSVYKMPKGADGKYAFDTSSAFPGNVPETGTYSISGVTYSSEPVRGNFFSLDYYSLTPRGNALLANAFISAINSAYRANIPAIDVNTLPTSAQ